MQVNKGTVHFWYDKGDRKYASVAPERPTAAIYTLALMSCTNKEVWLQRDDSQATLNLSSCWQLKI